MPRPPPVTIDRNGCQARLPIAPTVQSHRNPFSTQTFPRQCDSVVVLSLERDDKADPKRAGDLVVALVVTIPLLTFDPED
jgi:hypothetical protein